MDMSENDDDDDCDGDADDDDDSGMAGDGGGYGMTALPWAWLPYWTLLVLMPAAWLAALLIEAEPSCGNTRTDDDDIDDERGVRMACGGIPGRAMTPYAVGVATADDGADDDDDDNGTAPNPWWAGNDCCCC